MTLAAQVRAFMDERGLSPTQMAALVGTSRQNIANILSGKILMPKCLTALARTMGTSERALLGGSDNPPPAWPFEWITPARWASLTERQRGAAEKAAADVIAQFKQRSAK